MPSSPSVQQGTMTWDSGQLDGSCETCLRTWLGGAPSLATWEVTQAVLAENLAAGRAQEKTGAGCVCVTGWAGREREGEGHFGGGG